ncbi:MAG: Uma2 family endonuclease [Bacteroidota bacterium]
MPRRLDPGSLSLEDFHQMLEQEVEAVERNLELISGNLSPLEPASSRHSACVKQLSTYLSTRIESKALLSINEPVYINPQTGLRPDIALLKPRSNFYANAFPRPQDILLVIEVVDAHSYSRDVEEKLPLYAGAEIPEIWIVDISRDLVEVHSSPEDDLYLLRQIMRPGGDLLFLPLGISLPIKHIFPSFS